MNWQLTTYGGVIKNGYLWFSNNTFNGLFRMKMNGGEIEFVGHFPEETIDRTSMHKKCLAVQDYLYFFPALGNHIHIYNVQSGKFSSIEFPRGEMDSCSDAVLVKDKIYIFPADKQTDLYCLDIKTSSLQAIPSFRKQYSKVKGIHDTFLLCRVSYTEGKFIFAFFDTDIVAIFDLEAESLTTYHTQVPRLFAAFEHEGEVYMITNNTPEIFAYDFVNSPRRIYSEAETNSEQRRFNQICFLNQSIFVLPAFWGNVVQLKGELKRLLTELFEEPEEKEASHSDATDSLKESEEVKEEGEEEKDAVIMSFGYLSSFGHLLLLPFTKEFFYELDEDGNMLRKISFLFTNQNIRRELAEIRFMDSEEKLISEEEDFSLENLVEILKK